MTRFDQKGKEHADKVTFARNFPGLLSDADDTVGRTIRAMVTISQAPGIVTLIFTDDTFFISRGNGSPSSSELLKGIEGARQYLGETYCGAYDRLDELRTVDLEVTLQARLMTILEVIRKNIDHIPGMHNEIRKLLDAEASVGNKTAGDGHLPEDGR